MMIVKNYFLKLVFWHKKSSLDSVNNIKQKFVLFITIQEDVPFL